MVLFWKHPYFLHSLYCLYVTATKSTLQAILHLFFLSSTIILLDKLIILGKMHYAKQADPVYPFPGRDKRGKYTEKHNVLTNLNLHLQF